MYVKEHTTQCNTCIFKSISHFRIHRNAKNNKNQLVTALLVCIYIEDYYIAIGTLYTIIMERSLNNLHK